MDDGLQYSESFHESEDHGSFQNQASTPLHNDSLHGDLFEATDQNSDPSKQPVDFLVEEVDDSYVYASQSPSYHVRVDKIIQLLTIIIRVRLICKISCK